MDYDVMDSFPPSAFFFHFNLKMPEWKQKKEERILKYPKIKMFYVKWRSWCLGAEH